MNARGTGPEGGSAAEAGAEVPFGEAVRAWVRVAVHSFGGPAGQIAVLHRVAVDEKRWVDEQSFLRALSFCMLLPGPEAQQLATYLGWKLHGVRGGLVAGWLFVLPGFVSILALSLVYASFGDSAAVGALFYGLKPAVLAIVLHAVWRLRSRALATRFHLTVALLAFIALFVFHVSFPFVIVAAAAAGALRAGRTGAAAPVPATPTVGRALDASGTFGRIVVWLLLWLVPVGALVLFLGASHVLSREAVFFSKTAVVTFGGAYSVLAYVAQQAVENFGWLSPGEMLDGLGLAETTPGPLIQVVQFVGFLGAYRNPGDLSPLTAGVLGSIVTTWVTFAPCFLFIFAGAPLIERIQGRPRVERAMGAITAAVVGVILNLAVWFALHTIFADVTRRSFGIITVDVPALPSLDTGALLIAILAIVATFRLRAGMFTVLGGGAGLGMLWRLLF